MEQTFFGELQPELRRETLLGLPFVDAEQQCQLFGLCDDEIFWREYVGRHYFIRAKLSTLLSWHDVAEGANEILMSMFGKRVYPVYRLLPFLFQYYIDDYEDIDDLTRFTDWGQNNFANMAYVRDAVAKSPTAKAAYEQLLASLLPNLPITNNPNDVSVKTHDVGISRVAAILYTPFERRCASYIMEMATNGTVYLTPLGPLSIDFDMDALSAIPTNMPLMMWFLYNVENFLLDLAKMTFIKYFP